MECPSKSAESSELLIAYVEGSLDRIAERAFERHLDTCQRCREMAASQRELWAALDSWAPVQISPDFDQRLYRRLAEDRIPQPWWQRLLSADWTWRPAMPLAAACIALIAGFMLREPGPGPVQTVVIQPHGPQIEQVESALQDLEMLNQMGLPSSQGNTAREKM